MYHLFKKAEYKLFLSFKLELSYKPINNLKTIVIFLFI